MRFLGGGWLLALSDGRPVPRLLVLNTLLPQQDPRSWRILDLPPTPNPTEYSIFTRYEKLPGECSEFSVDPTQEIFVVSYQRRRAFVLPVDLFIRHVVSMRASPHIPWDEWGEGVITIYLHPDTFALQVFDTKVLALCGFTYSPEGFGVRMYDLSRSGRRGIRFQQVSEGAGESCRRVFSTPEWFVRCQVADWHRKPYSTQLVGDKVVCFFVSPLVYPQNAPVIFTVTPHRDFLAESIIYTSGKWVECEGSTREAVRSTRPARPYVRTKFPHLQYTYFEE